MYFQNKTVITVIVITVILFQIIPHFPCDSEKACDMASRR